MIIPVEYRQYSQSEYIVCPREPSTVADLRDRMLQRAMVTEGSYAFRLINELHVEIFLRSLDLKADYETYFACEYESFGEYLRRRARFPSETVATVTRAFGESTGIYHFRTPCTFLYEEYGLEILTQLLEDQSTTEIS